MKQKLYLSLFCIAVLSLNGCSSAKKQLGLERTVPDEFSVLKRAPLAMPPSYHLRPPTPGAPRPQEQATSEQARDQVFGTTSKSTTTDGEAPQAGTAESIFLQKAGVQYADPDIRQKVNSETSEVDESKKPVAERLLGIVREKEPESSVVDAKKESERIRQNIEEGKNITEGETPSIVE